MQNSMSPLKIEFSFKGFYTKKKKKIKKLFEVHF